jgi:hypothetical protein
MRQIRFGICHFINVEETGTWNMYEGIFCAGVAGIAREIPRGVENSYIGIVKMLVEPIRRYQRPNSHCAIYS